MKLDIPTEQVQVLAQLIDVAIKAGGISAARVGVPLFDLIEQQLKAELEPKAEEPQTKKIKK